MQAITGEAPIGACPCHDGLDCPDRAPGTIPATQLADLADLLGVLDEFLRAGPRTTERLTDFYARRGDIHPGFAANTLIDRVGFTAASLRQHLGRQRDGGPR